MPAIDYMELLREEKRKQRENKKKKKQQQCQSSSSKEEEEDNTTAKKAITSSAINNNNDRDTTTTTCYRIPEWSYPIKELEFSSNFISNALKQVFESIFSIQNREVIDNWGWQLVIGILTLAVGILMLIRPEISQVTLPFYIGFVVLFRSIWAIGMAIDMRSYRILSWGNFAVMGVLGSLLGFILIWNPVFAGLTAVAFTGLAFIIGGIFNVMISFRLKKLHDLPKRISKELMKRYNEVEDEVIKAMEESEQAQKTSG